MNKLLVVAIAVVVLCAAITAGFLAGRGARPDQGAPDRTVAIERPTPLATTAPAAADLPAESSIVDFSPTPTPEYQDQPMIPRPQVVRVNESTGDTPPAPSEVPSLNATVLVGGVEQEIVVPRGYVLPAVFLDESPNRTPQQQVMLEKIANDFLNEALAASPHADQADAQNARSSGLGASLVGGSTGALDPERSGGALTTSPRPGTDSSGNAYDPGYSPQQYLDAAHNWGSAMLRANERYRATFGDEAFNEWNRRSAIEALRERYGSE